MDKAGQLGLEAGSDQTREVLEQIKKLEAQGFTFEGAEASVDLMLRRAHAGYVPPFELIDFMVLVERRRGRGVLAEATVKVRVGPKIMHTAAEGNGPVNALDAALRKALVDVYPQLARVQAGRLQGAHPRQRHRHRRHRAGADRHQVRAAGAGAPSAPAPTSSRPAGARWPTAWSTRF